MLKMAQALLKLMLTVLLFWVAFVATIVACQFIYRIGGYLLESF